MPTSTDFQLDWLTGPQGSLLETPGRVALSACPGRLDLGGEVSDHIAMLRGHGIKVVVSLVEDREMEFYGAVGLRAALREAGMRSIHFPLVDTQPPEELFAARALCAQLLGWLGEGEHVLIHCIGGWGRSGTLAASLLTHQGYAAAAAIKLVRQARSPRCVESRAQENFVHTYATAQREQERYYIPVPQSDVSMLLDGVPGARRLRSRGGSLPVLRSAEELTRYLNTALTAQVGAAAPPAGELIVFSGEKPRPEAADAALPEPADWPVDRVFVRQDRVWRPVAFSQIGG